jgi:hypothetical protein
MKFSFRRRERTREEVAQILQEFLDGTDKDLSWDDFTLGMSFKDEELKKIQNRCTMLGQEFPAEKPSEYCNEQGRDVIRGYIKQLRGLS